MTHDQPAVTMPADDLLSKDRAHDAAMTAAMLMDGLRDHGKFREFAEIYDGGRIELVSDLTRYAALCDTLAEVGYATAGEYPGVYSYEVTSDFGTWIGEQILVGGGRFPGDKDCREKLAAMAYEFFEQAGLPAEVAEQLKTNLEAAAAPQKMGAKP